ncbi:MAG: hypothetical protein P1U53_13965, partial [Sulfitobacter sp.]|nr:hypothetical protein [Sulfitobacter sp.]
MAFDHFSIGAWNRAFALEPDHLLNRCHVIWRRDVSVFSPRHQGRGNFRSRMTLRLLHVRWQDFIRRSEGQPCDPRLGRIPRLIGGMGLGERCGHQFPPLGTRMNGRCCVIGGPHFRMAILMDGFRKLWLGQIASLAVRLA